MNPENPYRVLELERTADERAVKRAYVALIRKFPPETHPEEFQKIRAAYECLSDPEARKRFDEGERGYGEYGDELSRRLVAADDALSQEKVDLAREILLDLVNRFPDAVGVQEKLGHLHFGAGAFEAARAVFAALVAKEPTSARHQLHLGFALLRLDRRAQAGLAFALANKLDPKDANIAMALANYYISNDDTAHALNLVDATAPLLDPSGPALPILLLRKVDAYASVGRLAEAGPTVAELGRICARGGDPELRPVLAGQLGHIAAKLFATKRPGPANEVLGFCASLNPASSTTYPLPARIDLDPDSLPASFRAWLDGVAADKQSPVTVRQNAWLLPVGAFAALAVAAWIGVEVGLDRFAEWDAGRAVAVFAAYTGLFLAIFAWIRWVRRIVTSPLPSFTTLHPLYIVQVAPTRVRLYPLLALTEASGVHHHTNGIYTSTELKFNFGQRDMAGGAQTFAISISGQARAQGWIDAVLAVRGRALELLAEGCLDAEALVERLPPRTLAGLPPRPGWTSWRTWQRPLGRAAVAAALLTAALAWSSAVEQDAAAVARAASAHSIEGWRQYLVDRPDGDHVETARAQIRAEIDRALATFRANPQVPAEAALARAVEYVRDHDAGIRYEVEGSGAAFGEATRGDGRRHLATALRAAGFMGIAAPGTGGEGPQITVVLETGPATTLVPPALFEEAQPLTVYGATVTTRIAVPGQPVYQEQATVPVATRAYTLRGQPPEPIAARRLLERALDVATRAMGLRGPAAHLAGAP